MDRYGNPEAADLINQDKERREEARRRDLADPTHSMSASLGTEQLADQPAPLPAAVPAPAPEAQPESAPAPATAPASTLDPETEKKYREWLKGETTRRNELWSDLNQCLKFVEDEADTPEDKEKVALYKAAINSSQFTWLDNRRAQLIANDIYDMYDAKNKGRSWLRKGWDQMQTSATSLAAGFDTMFNSDHAEQNADTMEYMRKQNPRSVAGIEDIHSVGDFFNWGIEAAGEQAPNLMLAAAGGVAGGAIVGAAGLTGTAATLTEMAAAGVVSYPMNFEENAERQVKIARETGKEYDVGAAHASAIAYSAIDSISALWGAGRQARQVMQAMGAGMTRKATTEFTMRTMAREAFTASWKKFAKDLALDAASEGAQEVIQDLIGAAFQKKQSGHWRELNEDGTEQSVPDYLMSLANEAVSAAFTSFLFGGVGGAVSTAQNRSQVRTAQQRVGALSRAAEQTGADVAAGKVQILDADMANELTNFMRNESDFKKLDPFDQLMVYRRLVAETQIGAARQLDLSQEGKPNGTNQRQWQKVIDETEAILADNEAARNVVNAYKGLFLFDETGEIRKGLKDAPATDIDVKNLLASEEGRQKVFTDPATGMRILALEDKDGKRFFQLQTPRGSRIPLERNTFDNVRDALAQARKFNKIADVIDTRNAVQRKFTENLAAQLGLDTVEGVVVFDGLQDKNLPQDVREKLIRAGQFDPRGMTMPSPTGNTIYVNINANRSAFGIMETLLHENEHKAFADRFRKAAGLDESALKQLQEKKAALFAYNDKLLGYNADESDHLMQVYNGVVRGKTKLADALAYVSKYTGKEAKTLDDIHKAALDMKDELAEERLVSNMARLSVEQRSFAQRFMRGVKELASSLGLGDPTAKEARQLLDDLVGVDEAALTAGENAATARPAPAPETKAAPEIKAKTPEDKTPKAEPTPKKEESAEAENEDEKLEPPPAPEKKETKGEETPAPKAEEKPAQESAPNAEAAAPAEESAKTPAEWLSEKGIKIRKGSAVDAQGNPVAIKDRETVDGVLAGNIKPEDAPALSPATRKSMIEKLKGMGFRVNDKSTDATLLDNLLARYTDETGKPAAMESEPATEEKPQAPAQESKVQKDAKEFDKANGTDVIDIVSLRDIEVNSVATVFGATDATIKAENIVYDKRTRSERERALLIGHNSRTYHVVSERGGDAARGQATQAPATDNSVPQSGEKSSPAKAENEKPTETPAPQKAPEAEVKALRDRAPELFDELWKGKDGTAEALAEVEKQMNHVRDTNDKTSALRPFAGNAEARKLAGKYWVAEHPVEKAKAPAANETQSKPAATPTAQPQTDTAMERAKKAAEKHQVRYGQGNVSTLADMIKSGMTTLYPEQGLTVFDKGTPHVVTIGFEQFAPNKEELPYLIQLQQEYDAAHPEMASTPNENWRDNLSGARKAAATAFPAANEAQINTFVEKEGFLPLSDVASSEMDEDGSLIIHGKSKNGEHKEEKIYQDGSSAGGIIADEKPAKAEKRTRRPRAPRPAPEATAPAAAPEAPTAPQAPAPAPAPAPQAPAAQPGGMTIAGIELSADDVKKIAELGEKFMMKFSRGDVDADTIAIGNQVLDFAIEHGIRDFRSFATLAKQFAYGKLDGERRTNAQGVLAGRWTQHLVSEPDSGLEEITPTQMRATFAEIDKEDVSAPAPAPETAPAPSIEIPATAPEANARLRELENEASAIEQKMRNGTDTEADRNRLLQIVADTDTIVKAWREKGAKFAYTGGETDSSPTVRNHNWRITSINGEAVDDATPATAPKTRIKQETPKNQEQKNEAPSTNETREEASERPDVEPEANPVEGTEAQPEPQESVKEEAKTQKRAPATAQHTVVGKSLAPAIASAPTTRGARLAANIEAIRIAKDLDATGRVATEEEREKLAKFTGWGGLGGVFDNDAEMARLQEVLTSEEINAAELSANSAYFTPQDVTDALWNIARALGFKGGKMLEGSAGVGNIISAIPEDMRAGTDVRAVEIDPITSLILKGLHPKIEVDNAGFQDVNIPAGSVQLAITNVPFVTGLRVYDKANKDLSDKFNDLHDFCIAKNIRALAEGGIGIFITTSNTLDKSDALRRWITSEGNADVIGAFRLPNNTFGGTAVTSDIIVVRKRVGGRTAPGAIDVSISSNERTGETYDRYGRPVFATMYLNQYFHDHPEMMGGEMAFNFEKGETYRATSYGLFPSPSIDANARLADFVKGMEAKRTDASQDENEAERERHTFKLEDETIHEGELHVAPNGEVAIARDGESVPLDMKSMKNKVAGVNGKDKYTRATVVKDYSGIKASLHALLDAQKEADRADADITQLLEKFNAAYDEFVKKYGPLNLNNRINWLDRDIYWPELCALETIKQDTNPSNEGYVATIRNEKDGIYTHIGKSDVFNKRVIAVEKTQKPATVTDAVLLDYRDTARVDAGNVAKMLGISKEDATEQILKSGLAFIDPATGSLTIRHDYLSGNVREKLAIAQAQNEDGRFDENIRALNEVMPPTIPAHLIGYTLGSTWIPTHVYTKYFSDRFDVNVVPENIGGQWIVDVPRYASGKDWDAGVHSSMAGKRISGSQIAAAAMKGQSTIPVTKTTEVMGEKKTIHDKAAEATISAKIDEIRDDFKAFVQKMARDDEAFAAEVEKIYNEKFNNLAKRVIDERFLPDHFPGAAPDVNLYPHQKRAVILGTTQPVMLAHEVGSGKTYTLITTAMEMRRLGTARKPMVVVQNATIGQFVASAKRLYPAARILAPSKSDCTVEGRKEFYAKIKFNDWDMIIIPQSVFGLIPDSDDSEMAYLTEKIEEKRKTLEGLSASGADKRTMAQAQKELKELGERFNAAKGRKDAKKKAKAQALADEKVKERVKKLLDRKVDDVETFEDMGIDALLIDEAHNYKRLGFETTLTGRNSRVKGIDTATGPKTTSAYMKIRHILSTQNGRNVVMATGTPISNTAAEIFTFMRYLMPLEMRRQYGLEYFDDFVHNFGDISQLLEFTTSGDFKENTRFAGYFNTAELVRLWQTVSDTVLAKNTEVNASLPEISGGEAQDMFLPQTPTLIGTMKRIRQMLKDYEQMSGKEKMAHSDIPLRAFGLAKAAAIDARLLDPTANDEPGSKTNRAVEIILEDLEATKEHKGTVAVFCDRIKHQTGGKVDFNLFEDMKQKLIARGVPAGQIAIIEGRSMSDTKKVELFDKIKAGEIRVVFGSTETLGTGVNIQQRLHMAIHMDAPPRPMDYTQRNGRILRQGNQWKLWNEPVRIVRFGVEDTLDVSAYQRLKTKAGFINSVMGLAARDQFDAMESRSIEDAEEDGVFDNPVAMLSGSQYALLKNKAERDLRKLRAKKESYEADQIYTKRQLDYIPGFIKGAEKKIAENKAELDKLGFGENGAQTIELDGEKFDIGDEDGIGKKLSADFNKQLVAARKEAQGISLSDTYYKALQLPIKADGVEFVVEAIVQAQKAWDADSRDWVVHSSTTIGWISPALDIKELREVKGQWPLAAIEDIAQYTKGEGLRREIAKNEDNIKYYREHEKSLRARYGIPFAEEEALKETEARVADYEQKMKAELAEKAKKYAEAEASAQGVDIDEVGDMDAAFSRGDDESGMRLSRGDEDIEEEGYFGNERYDAFRLDDNVKSDIRFSRPDITVNPSGMTRAKAFVALASLAHRNLENLATGIKAQINAVQRNKILSNRAVAKSEANGFSAEEHNAAASVIGELWKYASMTENRGDRAGDANIASIKRFVAPLSLGDKPATAHLLVKESVEKGHRIYSLELDKLEASNGTTPSDASMSAQMGETPLSHAADNTLEKLGGETKSPDSSDGNSITQSAGNVNANPETDTRLSRGDVSPEDAEVQPPQEAAREFADADIRFSRREEEPPTKTGIGYKVFFLKNGNLYPPMVANPGGAATPFDVWLNADEGVRAEKSKNGRDKVKAGGKGTQGGGGTLAWRPGWHLGTIPYALQFNRGEKVDNPLGIKNQKGEIIKVGRYFPANFVWAEVEYAADIDYQEEAMSYGMTPNGKFQHSLAGLPRLPKDGFYQYRTNANPATDPWIITGAMRVKRVLSDDEVDELVRKAGREPQEREARFTREDANSINSQLTLSEAQNADQDTMRLSRGDSSRFEVTPEEAAAIRALDIHGGKNYLVGASQVARFYTQHEYEPAHLTKEKVWEESFGIDAPALVSEIVKRPRVLTPYEHAAMVRHLASYETRMDALMQRQTELEKTPGTPTETLTTLDNEIAVLGGAIKTIYAAFDYAGTEVGQAMAFRNLIQNAEMTAGWMLRRMKKQMDDFHVEGMPAGFIDNLERFALDYKRIQQELETAKGDLSQRDAEAAQMNEVLHNLRNRPKKDPVTRLNELMAQTQDLVDAQGELSDYQVEKLVKKIATEYVALDPRFRDVNTLLGAVRKFLDVCDIELDDAQVREYFAGRTNIYDRSEARRLANRLQKQVAKAVALEEALQNGDVREMRRVCRKLGIAIHEGQAIIDAQNAAILAMLDEEIAELEAQLGEKPEGPRMSAGERSTPMDIPDSGKARLERLRALHTEIANADADETRTARIREYARSRLASEQARLQNIIGKTREEEAAVPPAATPELEDAERELRDAEREEREARRRGEQSIADQEQKRIQRLREKVAALEKQVLDAQEGFFMNDMPKLKKRRAMTAEESALVQRIAELRHAYRTLLDAQFPGEQSAEERAIRARQRAIQRSIDHLQNKMEGSEQAQVKPAKDYSNDPRLDGLKQQLRDKKREYLEWEAAQKWKSMSTGDKALKTVADFFDLTKSLVASGDLSAIWTQCGWMMLGNPRLNVRAVRDGLRALFSGKQSEEIMNKLARDYDLARFVEDGLQIHAVGTAAESEMFARDSNPLLNKLLPQDNKIRKLSGMWLEASARGFDTPINIIRATTYAAALDACQKHGKMLGKEERQTLAQLINYATGTGDLSFFKNGAFRRLLWAPARISGQIQTIQNMVNLGLSSISDKLATRKFKNFDLDVRRAMFWQVYGKSLANYILLSSVLYALSRLMWDDDDDDKRLVGKEFFNPLSAQFLKYNLAGNYFAPLGGMEIYLRTMARTVAGGRTDRYGRFKEFDGYQNGTVIGEIGTTFVMNKLSPTMQLAAAALNREAKFETLETPGQILQYVVQNTVYPLTLHDSVEAMTENGIPTGAALTFMNLVGLSSWSYGHVKRDTAVRSLNASLKAYNEFAKNGEAEKLRALMNRYDWLKPQYRVRLTNLAGQYRKIADKNKKAIAAGRANANMMARQAQLAEQIYAIMHEAEGQ